MLPRRFTHVSNTDSPRVCDGILRRNGDVGDLGDSDSRQLTLTGRQGLRQGMATFFRGKIQHQGNVGVRPYLTLGINPNQPNLSRKRAWGQTGRGAGPDVNLGVPGRKFGCSAHVTRRCTRCWTNTKRETNPGWRGKESGGWPGPCVFSGRGAGAAGRRPTRNRRREQ